MDTIALVKEFYTAAKDDVHRNPRPIVPSNGHALLKIKFMNEELAELAHAFCAQDPVKIIDALTDLQYFLDGIYLLCGMQDIKEPAFEEVHRSNMTKFVHQKNEKGEHVALLCFRDDAGKIIKPEGYKKPNLEQFFKEKNNEKENLGSGVTGFPMQH